MRKAKIVLLGVVAANGYGVAHDEITARVCVEYFSLAHPPVFPVRSLTMLALCWGVASTLMVGAIFGGLLALLSEAGGQPPIPLPRLARGVLSLLAVTAGGATVAGALGFWLTRYGWIGLPAELAGLIPANRHAHFMAAWFVHVASYAVGFLCVGVWFHRLWRERGRPFIVNPLPRGRRATARAACLAAAVLGILYYRFIRG